MLLGYNDGGAEVFQETIILPAENLKVNFQVPRSHVHVSSTYFEVIVLRCYKWLCGLKALDLNR